MKLMYINGEFTKGNSNGEIEVTNPATEEVLDTVRRGTAEDVESAVRSSKEAFNSWRKVGANDRTNLLHEIASKVRNHQEEIVHLLTLEEGKPVSENEEELEWVASTFDYYAELGRSVLRQTANRVAEVDH
jgi:acyl-CoA reductase-like NAD-dependent aldehyde dehydrogenase